MWSTRYGVQKQTRLSFHHLEHKQIKAYHSMARPSARQPNELRGISFDLEFNKYAEGSCLIKCGDTHVLCTASLDDRVPPFLRNSGRGWVTAEYGMLPRSTNTRMDREAAKGKQSGRT